MLSPTLKNGVQTLLKPCLLLFLLPPFFTACTSTKPQPTSLKVEGDGSWAVTRWLGGNRPTVPQGFFISRDVVGQLKTGMSAVEVRELLGPPPFNDPFHPDRLDYPFRYDDGKGLISTSSLTLLFDTNAKLAHIEERNIPADTEFLKFVSPSK